MKIDRPSAVIIFTLFLSNSISGLAAPFLPIFLSKRGIEDTWIGLIFASYAIGLTFGSPIVGKIIDKTGHRKIMIYGTLLMSIACSSFGLAKYIENNTLLILVGVFLRFL